MKNLVLAIILVSTFASCNFIGGERVKGNGVMKTEQRNISKYDEVHVSGAINVFLSQGELKSVQLEGDENLLQYVELVEEGDKLTIKTRDGYNLDPSKEMKVFLTAPEFREVEVSGACNITGQTKISGSNKLELHASGAGSINMEVDVPELVTRLSGSGEISLKGQTKTFDLSISGAANAHCFDLLSEETKVEISGAGDAEVYASQKLEAHVSGAGNVKYKGEVKNINQQVSGAGSVEKAD